MSAIWILLSLSLAVIAWLFALLLGPVFIRLSSRWSILDVPGKRSLHTDPVPLLGGGVVLASCLGTFLVAGGVLLVFISSPSLRVHLPPTDGPLPESLMAISIRGVIVGTGALLVFGLGVFDDIRNLRPLSRLTAQLAIATAVVLSGLKPEVPLLSSPFHEIFAVLWIAGITNAFNLVDGVDGLAAGVAVIAGVVFGVSMAILNQPLVACMLSVISGAALGFLRYNKVPARIFLGSSGALLLGYVLAVATLVASDTTSRVHPLFGLLFPPFILAVPLYDMISVLWIRLRERRGLFTGDRSHLHHRLLDRGFSPRKTARILQVFSAVIALNAIVMLGIDPSKPWGLIPVVLTTVLGFYVIERKLHPPAKRQAPEKQESPSS